MKLPTKIILVAVAALIVYVGVSLFATSTARQEATGMETSQGSLPGTAENTHLLDDAGPDAPTLVEYLDFECEACGAFYPYIEEIRAEYDGQINYAVRYFPLPGHKNSMNAALAVEAAAQQGKFEDMYQVMFETQASWGEQQTSQADVFRGYAQALGLDMDAYDAAVVDPATAARIAGDFREGQRLGIQGTPTFLLEGQPLELTSLDDLTSALDAAIAGS